MCLIFGLADSGAIWTKCPKCPKCQHTLCFTYDSLNLCVHKQVIGCDLRMDIIHRIGVLHKS